MFKVKPFFREMIWGNPVLNEIFGLEIGENPIGEVWLVSGLEPMKTPLLGKEGEIEISPEITGLNLPRFPLLIKLISSSKWLSVQVHPDDFWARELEGEPWGKTEGWYFLKKGEIALGKSKEAVENAVKTGNWESALDKIEIYEGEFVFLPAGTVHTLGPGSTLIEIQQTSDLTYRLYDWGRPRETHVEKALKVLKDFKRSEILKGRISEFTCQYFSFEIMEGGTVEGFKILIFLDFGTLEGEGVEPFSTHIIEQGENIGFEGRAMVIDLGDYWKRIGSG